MISLSPPTICNSADRLVCPVCDAAAAGLQGKIMTASQPAESGQL
nr:hypothetical protein [Klebsiella pneumoniae]